MTALPRSYPRQVGLTCGEANARSVVESFGIQFTTEDRPRRWVHLFGYALIGDMIRLLAANGLEVEARNAPGLDEAGRVRLLKDHLDAGKPVILSIGNGYLKRGRYTSWSRLLCGHYLTVYGYDDEQEAFFVYDSYLAGDPSEPLPAGNDMRNYRGLVRDWKGPLYYPLIGRWYCYLSIGEQTG